MPCRSEGADQVADAAGGVGAEPPPARSLSLPPAVRSRPPQKQLPFKKLYYAHPYKSWQKGGVENVNKLLRQYLPKGFSFMPYSNSLPSISCKKINNRPRRILNSKSPQSLIKHLKLGI